jgi:hypothetical protein
MILSLSSGANLAYALQLHGEWVIGQFRISAEGHLLDVLLKSVTTFATATLASAAFQASSINIFLLPGCISCAPHHSPVQINSFNDQRLLPFLLHKFLKCHAHFHSHPGWPLFGALIFVSCSYISSRGF